MSHFTIKCLSTFWPVDILFGYILLQLVFLENLVLGVIFFKNFKERHHFEMVESWMYSTIVI